MPYSVLSLFEKEYKEYEDVVLNQRYRILDMIGKGGMGQVNRALDRLSQQTIALKQVTAPRENLRLSISKTTDFRLALAQEFRTLASLRHPHIISVLDYGFDSEKHPFFTMDLLQQPLSITQAARKLPYDQKRDLFLQLLQAIEYLHRRNVVHRDLKPDNVLVIPTAHGLHVKVLDFGLAMAHTQAHHGETMVGTLHYMAPELLAGEPHSREFRFIRCGFDCLRYFQRASSLLSGRYDASCGSDPQC